MTKKDNYNYIISTIIPIYNSEKYLEKSINSIINQSINFKNIQLILINDGSTDNSESICIKYADKYPNNIIYIKKKNGGVSSARNIGIDQIKGKYVNFFDSDDLLSKNAYKNCIKILEKNDDVDVSMMRLILFKDRKKVYHYLDNKFTKRDRVVNLTDEPVNPNLHLATCVFRSKLALEHYFDTKLKISEDVKYLSELLCNSGKIAYISSACYFYRKSDDLNSAIQSSTSNISYYLDTPNLSYGYILDLGKKYTGLSDYFQNTIISDLRWRLIYYNQSILNEKNEKDYLKSIKVLLKKCKDKNIINQYKETIRNINTVEQELIIKYGKPIIQDIKIDDKYVFYKNDKLIKLSDLYIEVFKCELENDKIHMNLMLNYFFNSEYDIYVKNGDKYYKAKKITRSVDKKLLISKYGDFYNYIYDIELNINDIKKLDVYIKINDKYFKLNLVFSKFSKLNNSKYSFTYNDEHTLSRKGNSIMIDKPIFMKRVIYVLALLVNMNILPASLLIINAIIYPFIRHDNWLVSDRVESAGDNGEWFFKYLVENNPKKNLYFVLNKKSNDYSRIKKLGKVIPFNSLRFYIKYLNSEVIVSSQANNFIIKPYGRKQIYLNPFLNSKFVFLQHGIIKDDLSEWLNIYNKNLDIFVCSAKGEYDSIVNGNYMYGEDVVKLTGLPRFDGLFTSEKTNNTIMLCPTWRSSLVSREDSFGKRSYNDKFKESEFCKFYNKLLTDKELGEKLKKYNYKIRLCLHPNLIQQIDDFKYDKSFVDVVTNINYNDEFRLNKLMVTDYSSTAFDFAYLRKSIIYNRFDEDVFFKGQIYDTGYFDYDKDGLGKVVRSYEDLKDEIIHLIENDCVIESKYEKRINKFFKFNDQYNSYRVYGEIEKMLNVGSRKFKKIIEKRFNVMLILILLLFGTNFYFLLNQNKIVDELSNDLDLIKTELNIEKENKNEKNNEIVVNKKNYIENSVDNIPIITYHRIVDHDTKVEYFSDDIWANDLDVVSEQLKYLSDNDWKTITLDEFYCWYQKECDFPEKSFIITIDDGDSEVYYNLLPLLEKYNFSATAFIVGSETPEVTNKLEEPKRRKVGLDIVNKLRSENSLLSFESHTYDFHYKIDDKGALLQKSESEIVEDYNNNKKFGFKYLAFPYGHYNNKALNFLKKSNIKMAFGFSPDRNVCASRTDNVYIIPRLRVTAAVDMDEFINLISCDN